ncbi:MAG: hypothetical protein A3K19_18660 [Lentisphaerae bacterium RIFOXYB12_FULL_65_16]|nr:MAG: hypothetical protein A3K18_00940 [Lentisphaerae bacterium RIFOXYA12_64_32]OGV92368.1 MAG: hypothetical protein A3K19_18660 [Lentisphaerae bacterium RIFOXYB12_FULL_65_16]
MKRTGILAGLVALGLGAMVMAQGDAPAGGPPAGGPPGGGMGMPPGGGEAMKAHMQAVWQKVNKEECFTALDKDGNGSVTKEEFEAADLGEIFGGGLRKAMMESMGGAGGPGAAGKGDFFQKMDKNGDGKITADEYPRGPEAFDKILQKADKDGDGALSKEEMQASREQMRDRKPRGEGGGKAKEGAKE